MLCGRISVGTRANGAPSARIIDCARIKSVSVRNRRSGITAPGTAFGVIHNRDFRSDTLFIRTEIAVGARSAQGFPKPCADEAPSARSVDLELNPKPYLFEIDA
jgi:hypothetical protein